jgi:hypothetical protein
MMTRQQQQVEAKFIAIGDEDCSAEEDVDQSLGDTNEMLDEEDERQHLVSGSIKQVVILTSDVTHRT